MSKEPIEIEPNRLTYEDPMNDRTYRDKRIIYLLEEILKALGGTP